MHPFQPKSVRLDLFGPPDDDRPPDTPQWWQSAGPVAAAGDGSDGSDAAGTSRRPGREAEAGPGRTHRGGESSD